MTDPLLHYPLSVRDGRLFVEDCDTVELAEKFGTPRRNTSLPMLMMRPHFLRLRWGNIARVNRYGDLTKKSSMD